MNALQKWFQRQKRTSLILRCTCQNIPRKQAFPDYFKLFKTYPLNKHFQMTSKVIKTPLLGKPSFLIDGFESDC